MKHSVHEDKSDYFSNHTPAGKETRLPEYCVKPKRETCLPEDCVKPTRETCLPKDCVKPLLETRFVKVFDLQYEDGKHYYDATRHSSGDIAATKNEAAFSEMFPDAVSCVVILCLPNREPLLLFSYEYRYTVGRYLLSVPAGLIDPKDKESSTRDEALINTAVRELREETGIEIKSEDKVTVINPCLFSTPGMTDESNALVCAVVHTDNLHELSQKGAVGSEKFDGFALFTKEEAAAVLRNGVDPNGHFYSVYTLAALLYFIADLWK